MAQTLDIIKFLELTESIPLIDVRSPSEYKQAHIPGAISIPIFDDEERAKVGARYKNNGKESAVMLGLEIVGPKLVKYVKQAKEIASDKKLLIHCWRGGMRSGSMAWLFETAGLEVYILEGGYKRYRNHILHQFSLSQRVFVLGGYTGSGKTDILKEIEKKGEQVLDLEGIAHHKGSAFGGIGQLEQPSSEQFENNLAQVWRNFDLSKTIWVEDESRQLGRCVIPDNLFQKMRSSNTLIVVIPKLIREDRLVLEYGDFDNEFLSRSISNIERRLGGLRTKDAMEALENGDVKKVASITLEYYDKAYLHGNSKREADTVFQIDIDRDEPESTAQIVIDYVKNKF